MRGNAAIALDARGETRTLLAPVFALIVYRLGQEILNLQSGVRFPVGAPVFTLREGHAELNRSVAYAQWAELASLRKINGFGISTAFLTGHSCLISADRARSIQAIRFECEYGRR